MKIMIFVNGVEKIVEVSPRETLSKMLRREGYLGVKQGCKRGDCGACSVLIDGKLFNSCIVPAASIDNKKITTIEGLGSPLNPHPIQDIFVKKGAVQCGFCTPGMVLATKTLLDHNPDPSTQEIKVALDGNLCRCTGYIKIIEAVEECVRKLGGKEK